MSPRICLIDTVYPDVVNAMPFDPAASYDVNLKAALSLSFGTADYYSRNLAPLGWQCADIIANHSRLQDLWAHERMCHTDILRAQIKDFTPDCIFFQDLSLLSAAELSDLSNDYVLAGQCSCPLPPVANVQQFDVIFSSLPCHIRKFTELGVKAVYNPLGFEPRIFWSLDPGMAWREAGDKHAEPERIHDVVFIGGVGNPSHWKRGMETLHAVAEAIPTFKWWGYGVENLPEGPLKQKYMGQCWGVEMFKTLLQSKVTVVRHGEVSEGYANNMKMFETAGTGSLLLTEAAPNLSDFFSADECVAYSSPADAVDKIKYYLAHNDERQRIAVNGQSRCLRHHTYAQRMRLVSEVLTGML